MDKMLLRGGKPLRGQIRISGAKNATLPLMTAALLTDETLTLSNVPCLADIATMATLLGQHGVELKGQDAPSCEGGRTVELRAASIVNTTAPYDVVRKMRASILVLGPLMARCRQAKVSLPGGCAIGTRPVDFHLRALQAMGAQVAIEDGYILASAPNGLHGAEIAFPVVTVTGTENILMAAALAQGETALVNAAREPEVADLARCLVAMGAQIEGIGTDRLRVQGQARLHGARHAVVSDRIEAGTYAMAAAITDGDIELLGVLADQLPTVTRVLGQAGIRMEPTPQGLRVYRDKGVLRGVDITTEPFPGFPTDLQAQAMALLCVAQGASVMTETIFENRFMHVPELVRMGADITAHGSSAMIRGVPSLKGAPVMATDLRASVSLVLAGLVAKGETTINRLYHLDRGYERLEEKLRACGADIQRIA